jgi:hypothetical protein
MKPLLCHCTTETSLREEKFSNQVILGEKFSLGEIWIPDLSGEIPTLIMTCICAAG